MYKTASAVALALSFTFSAALPLCAAEFEKPAAQSPSDPKIRAASEEGEKALKSFQVAPGLKADLWAAEPLLANRNDARLSDAVKLALADKNETLRKEATRVSASSQPGNATGQLAATLEKGTISEKQNAITTLGTLKDGSGDKVLADLLDQLATKKLAPELQLDVLEAAAQRATPALKTQLAAMEAARDKKDDLAAFRECLQGGDAKEGRKVFLEKVEASCVRCHKVGEEGADIGPNLSDVGKRKDRVYILESIVLPNKQIAPGFESVIVTLKNGTSYAGILKSETADLLEINSPEDGLLKVKKADVKARDKGLSGMVDGLGQILTRQDLRNLVEFLGTLQ